MVDYKSPWVFTRHTDVHNTVVEAGNSKSFSEKGSSQVDLADPSFKAEYIKRRNVADAACITTGNDSGDVLEVARYGATSDRMTSYCGIAKVACTFWISVLLFLTNDTSGRQYASPLDMSRVDVHYLDHNLTYYVGAEAVADDFRFMFVREPYSRLWSAYVDKFLLPDFWVSNGPSIMKRKKRRRWMKNKVCANNISFAEFADFVAASDPWKMNSHWKPVFLQCSPCLYRPHLIGKLETFSRDAREVLAVMNASWILDSFDPKQRVKDEVRNLISFNYYVSKVRDADYNCTSTAKLAQRLWKTFQINGYLDDDLPFPPFQGEEVEETELMTSVDRALSTTLVKSRKERKEQRERAMVRAYRTVSKATLYKLQDIYWNDFVMYGYDPEPGCLFDER
ncbi:carbohydrate sulfotransferase 8-like [Littorina saxatilis]|uniref:carbohydrate sulfotransferase 8-like n=1 Tax=Littorina saxatilis TaxID=31220 RepID=UPI0038B425E7